MDTDRLLEALQLGEDHEIEFKSARGGMPKSLWETYSAFANTDGGVIVLGVKQHGGNRFEIQGLDDAEKIRQDFWNNVNNKAHVSHNLLRNDGVRVVSVEGDNVLIIEVPRADRHQRPVFLAPNPLTGTYRRYHKLLKNLVVRDLLERDGHGRGATYRWAERLRGSSEVGSASQGPGATEETPGASSSGPGATALAPGATDARSLPVQDPVLLKIAAPARENKRFSPKAMRKVIQNLCRERELTARDIAELVQRNQERIQKSHLKPMVEHGLLERKHPEDPNHPQQAYRTAAPDQRELFE